MGLALRRRALPTGLAAAAVLVSGLVALPFVAESGAADYSCPAGYSSPEQIQSREQRMEAALSGRSGAAAKSGAETEAEKQSAASAEALRERLGKLAGGKDAQICLNDKRPEGLKEMAFRAEALAIPRTAPYDKVAPGAFTAAVKQRQGMKPGRVNGTAGTAKPYGRGPLVVDDPAYPQVNGLGLGDNSGRIDNFYYDRGNDRLYASIGSGGIWATNGGGNGAALGKRWFSVTDTLPTTVTGAVGYAPAKGSRPATLIALTGEPTFGASAYTGIGAYYATGVDAALAKGAQPVWRKATGVPDGALGFKVAVDPTNPDVVYAATSLGLFRSTDGGRSYDNARLPTGVVKPGGLPCAGADDITRRPECALANVVTDVVVQSPGGTTKATGGTVVAAVGWRGGQRANPDGTIQSPSNGIYRSGSGAPGTFVKTNPDSNVDNPLAFAEQVGIGRVELGATTGPNQDHSYLYAIVQDARLLNGGIDAIDAPVGGESTAPLNPRSGGTVLEGVYVSPDFGLTWRRMADDNAIARDPAAGSSLVGVGTALGYEPGVQAWYDMWIAPDPTQTGPNGVPTRLVFGLEELWENEYVPGTPNELDGVGDTKFKVIGRYFAGDSCQLLSAGLPTCPTNRSPQVSYTTHPDQQAGLFIPVDPKDVSKGVRLFVGNDGGAYRQDLTPSTADDTTNAQQPKIDYGVGTSDFSNGAWGRGVNEGFYSLLPYRATRAKDGTVWAGLQDNGNMKIDPKRGYKQYETYGGDGFFTAVDPNNSKVSYEEYALGAIAVTTDGGTTWTAIAPSYTNTQFSTPFIMDPTNAKHLLTGGRQVEETVYGPETGSASGKGWAAVYDLGTQQRPGDPSATASASDPANSTTAVDVRGDAAYVGFCGSCDTLNNPAAFKNGLATNVGGPKPGKRMTSNGWHIAAAKGLPNRYITSVAMDADNPKTVYVTLGGYTRRWAPPGTVGDTNPNVGVGHLFVSRDGGETFQDTTYNLPDAPATWVTLRGHQVLVGTDVGAFASDVRGVNKDGFAPLTGVPVAPVPSIEVAPGDPNTLTLALFGRGVWSYTFAQKLPGTGGSTGGAGGTTAPTVAGKVVGSTYGFESDAAGWTTSGGAADPAVGALTLPVASQWQRSSGGNNGSAFSFGLSPYLDNTTAYLTSPKVPFSGTAAAVRYALNADTEPGFDSVQVQWSADGGKTWNTAGSFTGNSGGWKSFTTKAFAVPSGTTALQVRFAFLSDSLVSSPLYTGAYVDDVAVLK